MGIPSCNTDRSEVGNGKHDHFYLAQPHQGKSRVTHRIIAGSYFRNISPQLEPILGRKEQGPEGPGCWQEAEPEQQALTIILIVT